MVDALAALCFEHHSQMKRLAAALLLCVSPLAGAGLPIDLVGATSTQAVIRYHANTAEACQVRGWFTFGGTRHDLHDLNGKLFPNAGQDLSRDTTITNGLQRTLVIGSRTAETASDGRIYSRALPAAAGQMPELSRVTVRVSCNGGADAGSIEIATANIPVGVTNPEPPPFNRDGFGNYGWPSIDWTDRAAIYVDPMTGLILKRMTGPGEGQSGIVTDQAFDFVHDPNNGWTNDENALNGWGGPYASTSGTDPLFLGYPEIRPAFLDAGGWGSSRASLDDVQVTVHGSCSGADEADRTVLVSQSMLDSGATTDGNPLAIVMPSSDGSVSVPATFPSGVFGGWGFSPRGDWLPSRGTLDADGAAITVVTALGSRDFNLFNVEWKTGAKIKIQGTHPTCPRDYCTIRSVESATRATLQENLGSLSGAPWQEAAPGVVLRKQNAVGSCELSARFDYAWSTEFSYDLNGATDRCSQAAVEVSTDKHGNRAGPWQGYLCTARTPDGGSNLYLLIPDTGEVRYLDDFYKQGGPQPPGAPAEDQLSAGGILKVGSGGFDASDGRSIYYARAAAPMDNGQQAILKLTYQGDFREHAKYSNTTQEFDLANITPASRVGSIEDQIRAKAAAIGDPWWDDAIWKNFNNAATSSSHFLWSVRPVGGVQDEFAYFAVFDLATGLLGNLVPTWNGSNQRWAASHTAASFGTYSVNTGHFLKARNNSHYFGGPFIVDVEEVQISGIWQTANTALNAGYAEPCEREIVSGPHWLKLDPEVQGRPGTTRCVSVRVDGEPCSRWPRLASNEQVDFPCPHNPAWSMVQTLQEGDWLSDPCANNTANIAAGCDGRGGGSGTNEKFMVAKKTEIGRGRFELRLVRWATCDKHVSEPPSANHTSGWQLQAWPTQHCGGNNTWIHASDPAQSLVPEYWSLGAGHGDFGGSQFSDSGADRLFVSSGGRVRFGPFPASIGKTVADSGFTVNVHPKWAGSNTPLDGIPPLQSYPSKRQWTAPDREQGWYLDFRHYNPSAGTIGEDINNSTSYEITCTLEPGAQQVYKCNNPMGLFAKTHPYFARAGRYILQDISAPTSARDWTASPFSDTDEWKYCLPLVNGECRPGSVAGSGVYLNVPKASLSPSECKSGVYSSNFPCFDSGTAVGGWVTQRDIRQADSAGTRFRRLTMGFSGPGRQYQFSNARATPDGKYAMIPGHWLDGVRHEVLLAKLPPWPEREDQPHPRGRRRQPANDHSTFVPYEIQLDPPSAASRVRVRFGYAENGPIDKFFCTSRREACLAGGSAPFDFEQTDRPQATPCRSGCAIPIHALPNRVVYYQAEWLDDQGRNLSSGPIEVAAVL